MNLIEIVWHWGDLQLYSAIMNSPFAKILFVELVAEVPTKATLDQVLELGGQLSEVEAAIDGLEHRDG